MSEAEWMGQTLWRGLKKKEKALVLGYIRRECPSCRNLADNDQHMIGMCAIVLTQHGIGKNAAWRA
jgi:hypothetical protein